MQGHLTRGRSKPRARRGLRRGFAADRGRSGAAQIIECKNAYCKYSVVHGEDWQVLDGMEDGISQITRKASALDNRLVWNFPVDVTYKATNAFGWPQLILSIYGLDIGGRDVIKGYGSVHFPTAPGKYKLKVHLYKPMSSSWMQGFLGRLSGTPAEFVDPKFPGHGDGREVVRAEATGHVIVNLNIMTRDMERFGYKAAGPLTPAHAIEL